MIGQPVNGELDLLRPLAKQRGQLLAAATLAVAHGTNDAQKTMGIIARWGWWPPAGWRRFANPSWVILTSAAIAAAGSVDRVQQVRWTVFEHIITSWLLTIPASAALSALIFEGISRLF
jgi:phosphate/sulfate permease